MRKTKVTPPGLARRWGISDEKVLAWIESGELRAIDASTRRGGRPRYLIDEADIADFEQRRAVVSAPPAPKRPKSKQDDVTEYF